MTRAVRNLLSFAIIAALAVLLAVVSGASARARHLTTCKGLEVTILDSTERAFVSPDDVKGYLGDYGDYIGQRIDSVDLKRIEDLIDGKSAVLKSEAYLTRDGMLHIDLTQREPVVRFHAPGNGFYADAEGCVFPLQSKFTARVPIVDGAVPVKVEKGFKGQPGEENGGKWLAAMLTLIRRLGHDRAFRDAFSQITVLPGGELLLVPRSGNERFYFGQPERIDGKLARIREYYETVAPSREPGYYRSVDVRFDRQIICKK